MNDIAIILLAAGESTRMGRSKQLLEVNGEPLLRRTARTALSAKAGEVLVVLGADENKHEKLLLDLPVIVVLNRHWKKGMGNSLKAGLQHVIQFLPETKAVIIMVSDQPLVNRALLKNLIGKYEECGTKIVASKYAGTAGVPALFDSALFQDLLSTDDHLGAKKIISQFPGVVTLVDFPGGEIDLDTENDYQSFISKY